MGVSIFPRTSSQFRIYLFLTFTHWSIAGFFLLINVCETLCVITELTSLRSGFVTNVSSGLWFALFIVSSFILGDFVGAVVTALHDDRAFEEFSAGDLNTGPCID